MKIKIMGGNMKKVLALVVFLFVFVFSLEATAEELPWKSLEEKGKASMQKESPFKLPEPLPEFDGIYIITTDGYIELKPEQGAYDSLRISSSYVRYRFSPDAFYSIPMKKFKGFLFIGEDYKKDKVVIERKIYCKLLEDGKRLCDLDEKNRYPVRLSTSETTKTKTINQFTYAVLFESPEKVFDTIDENPKGYNLIRLYSRGASRIVWLFGLKGSDSTF
jgi:hypothetical protein